MKLPPVKHLSYSSLTLFQECPRCWWLRYQYGYALPVPPAWELGGDTHEAIYQYHLTGKMPTESNQKALVEVYSQFYKPEDYDELEKDLLVDIVHPVNAKVKLGLQLMVKIDRIWDGWIHEVKTSSRKYRQEDVDSRIQTCLYSYAYRMAYKQQEKGVRYDVLLKQKSPKLQVLDTFSSQNDIAYGLGWIWNIVKEILEWPEPKYHHPNCYRREFMP